MTDVTQEELIELMEILKSPHLMKDLCSNYDKLKGKKHFEDFSDNGDCEDGEIDWVYRGSIDHFCDGCFYSVQCCVRDPYDRSENIYPSITFLAEFVSFSVDEFRVYPKMDDFIVTHYIRSPSHFNEVMDSWPSFVKDALEHVETHRKSWEDYLSPAPDTKELYYFVKNFLGYHIKSNADDIINFREIELHKGRTWDVDYYNEDYYDDDEEDYDEDYDDEDYDELMY